MAAIAVAAAVGAIGAASASTLGVGVLTAASAGWSIGSSLGGLLFPGKGTKVGPGPMMDLRITGTEYGAGIPYVRGRRSVPAQLWWNSDRRPRIETTTTGGKGGEPEVSTSTRVYGMSMLVGLTDNEIVGVSRIWDNGKLIWTNDALATSESINASANTAKWERITVYTGAADQLPDPEYESEVGAANAPAYRGRGTAFISSLQLGESGQLPNLTFEVVVDGEPGSAVLVDLPMEQWFTKPFGQWSCLYPQTQISESGDLYFIRPTGPNTYGSFELPCGPCYVSRANISAPTDYTDLSAEIMATLGFADTAKTRVSDPGFYVESKNAFYFVVMAAGVSGVINRYVVRYDVGGNTFVTAVFPFDQFLGPAFPRAVYDETTDAVYTGQGIVPYTSDQLQIYKLDADTLSTVDLIELPNTSAAADYCLALDPVEGLLIVTPGEAIGSTEDTYIIDLATFTIAQVLNTPDASLDEAVAHGGYLWVEKYAHNMSGNPVAPANILKYQWNGSSYDFVSTVFDSDALGFGWPSINYVPSENALLFCLYTSGDDYTDPDEMACELRSITDDSVIATIPFGSGYDDYSGFSNTMYNPSGGFLVYGRNWDEAGTEFTESPGIFTQWRFLSTTVSAICPTVEDVVSGLCLRAGLSSGQFDVTALSSITKDVCSFAIAQVEPTRQSVEQLMASHFFEMTLSDKIYFRPRGGSSVATIPYLDLGASMDGEQPEPLALKQSNELEIPAHIAVTYPNISDDYQTDTQTSDRLITATSNTIQTVNISALAMTPAEAKALADTIALDMVASSIGTTIAILGDYCRLEPTDPVTIIGGDGSSFRMRLVKKTDSYPLLTFEAVLDDVSVLTSQGITSADYSSSTVVAPPVDTLMELMDIPILRDADDDAGFYVATKGDSEPYPGSAVFSSASGVDYIRRATVNESAVFGECTTVLGDWTGPRVIDELNSVTVDVGDGELSSSTRDAVLSSLAVNAMLIGSEIIQFVIATLVSPGVYTLTRLLRGGRGTEWAMVDHVADEHCVLLRPAGIRRIVLENNELGVPLQYKGVTLGRALSTATAEAFTDNAVGLKPFSPFDLRMTRDGSNNITGTFQRRSRLSVRTIGALGINVPLGEASEAYEIDIYSDGTYTTVVRTISATTTSFSYSAAEQTADGLTPGNPVYAHVFQLSEVVGRGYALEAVA